MYREQNTRPAALSRKSAGVGLSVVGLMVLALGVALCGSVAGQPLPGSSNVVNPPPGAPPPAPQRPAGAAEATPREGLIVEPEPARVTGKIVRIEDNRITLETNDTNEDLTLPVDADAEIVLNKEPARLGDLRPGDFIRLTLTEGESPQASLVWAARIKQQADQPDQTFPPTAIRDGNDATGTGQGRVNAQAGGLGVVVTNTSGNGAQVVQVQPATPAEQARLIAGDIIVGLDDQPIPTGEQFIAQIRSHQPRDEVLVTILRQQQRQSARITLTSAARARDAVVDTTERRHVGVPGNVATRGDGFTPIVPFTGFPFSTTGPTASGTTAQQILQTANQVGQELRTLRQEMFRLHGVEAPPQVTQPFQFPQPAVGSTGSQSPTGNPSAPSRNQTVPPPIPPGGSFDPGTQPGTTPSFKPGTQRQGQSGIRSPGGAGGSSDPIP